MGAFYIVFWFYCMRLGNKYSCVSQKMCHPRIYTSFSLVWGVVIDIQHFINLGSGNVVIAAVSWGHHSFVHKPMAPH